jgi:hypothetical protein
MKNGWTETVDKLKQENKILVSTHLCLALKQARYQAQFNAVPTISFSASLCMASPVFNIFHALKRI